MVPLAPDGIETRPPKGPPLCGLGLLLAGLALGLLALGSLGWLGPLLRPRLVELDAPFAVLGLLQRQPCAEALARSALEAGHGLLRATRLDQLARNRDGQL